MKKDAVLKICILLAGAAVVGIFYFAGIDCLFQRLFRVECPGCGMTHAIVSCLKLDFAAAFQQNPLVFLLPALLVCFFKDGVVFKNRSINNAVLIGFVVLIMFCYGMRVIF